MQKTIYILFLIILSSCINGHQDKEEKPKDELLITKMFKAKLDDYSSEIKDSLLQEKLITLHYEEDGFKDETFLHLSIDSSKNTIRVESTESLNSSFAANEYRAVTLSNSEKLIYSKTVGTTAFTNQDKFEIFNFDSQSGKLILDSISTSFFNLKMEDLFQQNTPDSIIEFYQNNANFFFSIFYADKGIGKYCVNLRIPAENMDNWLIGESVTFDTIDNRFTKTTNPIVR